MGQRLIDICNQLGNSQILASQNALLRSIENADLFPIAYAKSETANRKISYFSKIPKIRIQVVTSFNNFDFVSSEISGKLITLIPHTALQSPDLTDLGGIASLQDSLIILTSNSANRIGLERLCELVEQTPHTIYAIHDFDSHHWHDLGIRLAAIADVYLPGHPTEHLVASRINPHVISGIYTGTTQWSRTFLLDHIPKLGDTQRSEEPFGPHSHYPSFEYRNKVVSTFTSRSKMIRLQVTSDTNSFLQQTNEERWGEWINYKIHLIAPVAHDIPNRFFDALITGGIPMIPNGLKSHVISAGIPKEYFVCYSPSDIIDPTDLFGKARKLFDEQGKIGCIKRSLFAFENYHVDMVIEKIVAAVSRHYLDRYFP